MLPATVSDITHPETLHTNAQVGAVQELRVNMEGNMLAMVVSDAGTYAPSPSNFPYTYPGALKEKPESSAGSDSGASNRASKKVRVIISSNGTSFTIARNSPAFHMT